MAKKQKKVSSDQANCAVGACAYSPSMDLDFNELEAVEGLKVGDTVRVVVKGTIMRISQREPYEKGSSPSASIGIKDFEACIVDASTQFDSLLDEDDD